MIAALLLLLHTSAIAAPGDFELFDRLLSKPGSCSRLADGNVYCRARLGTKSRSVVGESPTTASFESIEARGLGVWDGRRISLVTIAVALDKSGRRIGRHVDYARAGQPAHARETLLIQFSRDGGVSATRVTDVLVDVTADCEMKDIVVIPAGDGGELSRCLRSMPERVAAEADEVVETLREAREAATARL